MNVKAPYLTMDEARAIIETDALTWEGSEHQSAANREGWNIFNLLAPGYTQPIERFTDAGISRYDEPEAWDGCERKEPWDGDEAVVEHLQANADNPTYATALKIEHALNSIRFHTWGEAYVDSRMGPDR